MDACSIEIDESLASLQADMAKHTGITLDVRCADAATFDYASLGFGAPAVFTGGLPQMGDLLAAAVVRGVPRAEECAVRAGRQPPPARARGPRRTGTAGGR